MSTPKLNYKRGALYALAGPAVGIITWAVLWEFGFIASLATFLLAWLTIKMFRKGAGGIDRKALKIIVPYIVVGVVLSILAGIADDALYVAQHDMEEARGMTIAQLLSSIDFWSFFGGSLTDIGLWKSYATDLFISVALAGFGAYGTIKDVLVEGHDEQSQVAQEQKS